MATTGLALAVFEHSRRDNAALFLKADIAAYREGGLDVRR